MLAFGHIKLAFKQTYLTNWGVSDYLAKARKQYYMVIGNLVIA
jgi:hypothetical protein